MLAVPVRIGGWIPSGDRVCGEGLGLPSTVKVEAEPGAMQHTSCGGTPTGVRGQAEWQMVYSRISQLS